MVQLTSDDLRSMARAQGELSPQTEEKSQMHNNVEAGSSSSDKQSVDKDIHGSNNLSYFFITMFVFYFRHAGGRQCRYWD